MANTRPLKLTVFVLVLAALMTISACELPTSNPVDGGGYTIAPDRSADATVTQATGAQDTAESAVSAPALTTASSFTPPASGPASSPLPSATSGFTPATRTPVPWPTPEVIVGVTTTASAIAPTPEPTPSLLPVESEPEPSPEPTPTPVVVPTRAPTHAPGTSAPTHAPGTPTPTPQSTPQSTPRPTPSPTHTAGPQSQYFTDGEVIVTGTTYKSADLYVKVTHVSKDKQNYYIADCRMRDSGRLFTAFANDRYAMNTAERTSVIAKRKGAVIAVNGDYYNARRKSIVIRNGKLYRSTPWHDVAAIYKDGTMRTFSKTAVTSDSLMKDGALQVFGFGPILLDQNGKMFELDQQNKQNSNYASNPRTGIGYIRPNHFVLVVVDGRKPSKGRKGMTRDEFAKLFESLGCKSAYNLDGGGSSTMVFMGKVINHPSDSAGERKVGDIIYFGEKETDPANVARFKK